MSVIYINREKKRIIIPEHRNIVVLSPTFYWYKPIELNLSKRKIKKLLPSLMSEKPQNLSKTHIIKTENGFLLFAFDETLFASLTEEFDDHYFIFAQSYFKNIKTSVQLNEETVLLAINGIIFESSKELITDSPREAIHNYIYEFDKKEFIYIPKASNEITSNFWKVLIAATIIMALAMSTKKYIEIAKISGEASALSSSEDSFTQKALFEKYKKTEETEAEKRKKLADAISKKSKEIKLTQNSIEIK